MEGKILIIEDQDYIAELLRDVVELLDQEAVLAGSGEAAEQALATHAIQLVIMDLSLPDINGIDLYKKIIPNYPHLEKRIIFMSGYEPQDYFDNFLRENSVRFMPKPVMIKDFQEMIKEFIDR